MITTLFGKKIPDPDGDFGDYKLPDHICDDLYSIYSGPNVHNLRWKKKEDMEKVVSIYNELSGVSE